MRESIQNKNVFYFEDFDKSWLREELVGRKGLSLLKLNDMDVPVPEFFILNPRLFRELSSRAFERVQEKLLQGSRNPEEDEIENAILRTEFPRDIEDELLSAYTRISGFADAWVSVRSSIVFPENLEVSFSGIFATELNVRGFSELKDAIRKVYSSFFTDDAVMYASKHGVDLNNATLAVVIQKMVQAEVSGSAFTVDPVTQDKGRLSIEAVFGLGEVISSGEITPDLYILNKRDLNIIEQTISPQEWMKVRLLGHWRKGKGNIEKVKISKSWSYRPKLNERELEEIAKIALVIEDKGRNSQNIEWVLSGGKVWVLQNKPLYETGVDTKVRIMGNGVEQETLRDVVEGFVLKSQDIEKLEGKAVDRAKKMISRERKQQVEDKIQEMLLAKGIGGSFGELNGKVLILEKGKIPVITKRDVLIIKSFSKDLESEIVKSGAVVMETGGLTSDVAILCREFRIPAVFGATGILDNVKEGDLVKVDGNSGTIYKASKGEVAQDIIANEDTHPVIRAYEEGEVKKTEEKIEEEIEKEEIIKEKGLEIPKDNNLPPSATKVYVSADDKLEDMIKYAGNSNGIVCIDMDQLLIDEGRHILAFVEDKKFVDYANKLSDKICEYIDLAQGDQVILSLGSSRVEDFKNLTKGNSFENDSLGNDIYGLSHYLDNQDLLKYVLKIVKRIRNVKKKRNVSLAVHSPMNADMMVEFKKIVSSEGLKRTSTFEMYAIIDSPAEVIQADEILGINIDGIIVNTPWIAKQMQGYPAHHQRAKYELGVNSVFKMVDNVIDDTRKDDKKCIVVVEDSKDLIKHVVQSGVYGIVVNGEDVSDARKLVAQEETKLIMNL